jgi:hypothetical protein
MKDHTPAPAAVCFPSGLGFADVLNGIVWLLFPKLRAKPQQRVNRACIVWQSRRRSAGKLSTVGALLTELGYGTIVQLRC